MASALAEGAKMELYLTPKPGLVDLEDTGSHTDLNIPVMEASIGYVAEYLDAISESLLAGEAFPFQKQIAIEAEQKLYSSLGTNTHKGYIFLSGMLLIAMWHAKSVCAADVRVSLARLSQEYFLNHSTGLTNGSVVREKLAVKGIVLEATLAYPALFDVALPAYRELTAHNRSHEEASFLMLARLMQVVEDTTTLHRGGARGLARVKSDGEALERVIIECGDYVGLLRELNRAYVQENLTIGGVADMIGLAFSYLVWSGECVSLSAVQNTAMPEALF